MVSITGLIKIMILIYGNRNLINNRDFRNYEGRTNYLYRFVDAIFTYFLVGCTTSLYNIRNMHASTAPPNNMRINSNDEGDSPLVIRI